MKNGWKTRGKNYFSHIKHASFKFWTHKNLFIGIRHKCRQNPAINCQYPAFSGIFAPSMCLEWKTNPSKLFGLNNHAILTQRKAWILSSRVHANHFNSVGDWVGASHISTDFYGCSEIQPDLKYPMCNIPFVLFFGCIRFVFYLGLVHPAFPKPSRIFCARGWIL